MYRYEQTNWPRRVMRLSGTVPPITWFYARALHHIDGLVYRASRGRTTFTSWVAGLPIMMLTTTGARSGRRRTLPVIGVPHDESVVVIASNYGQEQQPGLVPQPAGPPPRPASSSRASGETWSRAS